MTDLRDTARTDSAVDAPASRSQEGERVSISRRALLRGASAAVPTILTLKSGAALAQSSNLVGTVRNASQAMGDGGVQCVQIDPYMGGTLQQVDLGSNPMLHVQYIKPRKYYRTEKGAKKESSDDLVSIEEMCRRGGEYATYWYRDGDRVRKLVSYSPSGQPLRQGFMVSATALGSFSSAIKAKTYF